MGCLNILAFDTALTSCSAAVVRDGAVVSELFDNRPRGQAERLIPMCLEVCGDAGIAFENLDAVAATRGPGTFTGVRIGLAAARGMALALMRPLIGVTTLEMTARKAVSAMGAEVDRRIAVCHDARRSQIYLQLFDLKAGQVNAVFAPAAVPLTEVARYLDDRVTALLGTAGDIVKPFLSQAAIERLDFPDIARDSNAAMVGVMAWERLKEGELFDEVAPLYLRPPDAVAAKIILYPFQNI